MHYRLFLLLFSAIWENTGSFHGSVFSYDFLMNGQHAESLIRILPMGQLRLIALQKFDRTTVPLSLDFLWMFILYYSAGRIFYMQI